MITLYHGSKDIIEKPIHGRGFKYNDFGPGFYCSKELDIAKESAVDLKRNGYVNIYKMHYNNLLILDLFRFSMIHWLVILLRNRELDLLSPFAAEAKAYILRHFTLGIESYDVVIGFRADGSYFSYAQDFLNGEISYRQFCKSIYLGDLGRQVVIKSKRAINRLVFTGYEEAKAAKWYERKVERDQEARREYYKVRSKREWRDIYIHDIIMEEMKPGDRSVR